MSKHQVKFYVNDDEKKRLDHLAKRSFMSIPMFSKVTALGVEIKPIKEVYVAYENTLIDIEPPTAPMLTDTDKQAFREFMNRTTPSNGFYQVSAELNKELYHIFEQLLKKY